MKAFFKDIENDLILDEGKRLKPYLCPAGKLTIGYGRNLADKGISGQEALCLLRNDIYDCVRDLVSIFEDFPGFSDNRKRALLNMRYNLGSGGFRSFNKMILAVKREDWHGAAKEAQNSKWYGQVGKRAERVVEMLEG